MSDYAETRNAIAALNEAVDAVTAENASLRAQLADATNGSPDTRLGDFAKEVHRHATKLRQSVTDSSAVSGGEAARATPNGTPMTEAERRGSLSDAERKVEDGQRPSMKAKAA